MEKVDGRERYSLCGQGRGRDSRRHGARRIRRRVQNGAGMGRRERAQIPSEGWQEGRSRHRAGQGRELPASRAHGRMARVPNEGRRVAPPSCGGHIRENGEEHMKDMSSTGDAKAPSRCGARHTRFPWRAACAVVGFIGLCWVIEYVLIPAVLWAVLALFGEVPA